MNTIETKYSFPKIEKILINNFSLYKKNNSIEIEVRDGVFCLAGANGLGKSTFLNILNFGLTGVVINPEKDFGSIVSLSKFYSFNRKFAETYFDGRISEEDRESARVIIQFSIGDVKYLIERSFFDIEELIQFSRIENGENTVPEDLYPDQLHNFYCDILIKDIKLATFDQFVFLQHFIFTFDEHHYLLFWDKSMMETTLYLFFGVNVNDALEANNLRKRINQLGSNIRNFTYQKNRTVKDVSELKQRIDEIDSSKDKNEIVQKFEQLNQEKNELEENLIKNSSELKHCDLTISDKSIKISNLRSSFEKLVSQLMNNEFEISNDSYVTEILRKMQNDIRTGGDGLKYYTDLRDYIKKKIKEVENIDEEKLSKELSLLDIQINQLDKDIQEIQKRKERLTENRTEIQDNLQSVDEELLRITKEEDEYLFHVKSNTKNDWSGLLKSYFEQIDKSQKEIDQLREEREEKQKDLKKLERILSKNFSIAEKEFIPIFQKYVESFLGLDVSIKLRNSTSGTSLVLEINDTERTSIHQLSESQRYFVDIGLRMALIQFKCQSSFLLVDTPEGSLDIAYESKAGKMFAEFTNTGHNLFMTANINTSQLLIELAKECKHEKMNLERMTEWTYLSEVQNQENEKIQMAYKSIEESLNSK